MGDVHVDLLMFGSVISESEKKRLTALFPEAEIGTCMVSIPTFTLQPNRRRPVAPSRD